MIPKALNPYVIVRGYWLELVGDFVGPFALEGFFPPEAEAHTKAAVLRAALPPEAREPQGPYDAVTAYCVMAFCQEDE